MRFKNYILALFLVLPFIADAQKDIKKECVPTVMFSVAYSYQFPGADTKILYGNNSTIGAGIHYKTDKNWLWSLNANFISGDNINASREDILGIILDNNGELITGESYYLMKVKNKKGKYLSNVRGRYDFDFNAVAYMIPLNTDTEFNVDWKQMYGELKPGTYRLVKGFTELRENGNHNDADYWVEFVIE